MIKIIYEDNHLLVVEKPINIPVQKDNSQDEDLLSLLKQYIKKKYNKPGEVYLGLVHRLDRPTGGIMVFARTSKSASRLSEQIRKKQFRKSYYAIVEGKVPKESDTFEDKLLKDEKNNIVKIDSQGKYSKLSYKVIKQVENKTLVDIELETGRSHQIRVQFSSRGFPLYGDHKYNKNTNAKELALFAYKIEFFHPTTKELLTFEIKQPKYGVWKIFK